jgi:TRAP-type C4-dicarboxylate transport system permease small subunit
VRRLIRKVADAVGVVTFATMFLAFLLQVFMRYVVGRPLGWTDELSLITYVWGIFWACAFMARDREHVAFDMVYQALPARGQRLAGLLGAGLMGGLFLVVLPATVDYVRFMARERTWVLGVRFDLVFVCFALFVVAVIVRSAARIRRLLGHDWRESL